MKIIKSLLLVIGGLFTTALLHAQDVKAEIAKPVEVKAPALAVRNNTTSPTAGFKPQPGAAKEIASPASAETPSPSKNDETKKPAEELKAVALTVDPDFGKKNLTAEQLKTLNGTADNPKAAVVTVPNTVDHKAPPVTKSTAVKQQ